MTKTLGRRCVNVIKMFFVYWVYTVHIENSHLTTKTVQFFVFHQLEVVARVSETQLQVGDNFGLKELDKYPMRALACGRLISIRHKAWHKNLLLLITKIRSI